MQRVAQPHQHKPAKLWRVRAADMVCRRCRQSQSTDRGRGLRRQRRAVHAVDPVRLSHPRSRRDAGRCVRRRYAGLRECGRRARGPRRTQLHVQLLRNRHADLGQGLEPDAFRTLQPHDGQEQRQPHSPGRTGFADQRQHVFAASTRRSASRSRPVRAFSAYFGYNEGSRAPSSIELGCADPENPCKLPNAMAGDPPLKQVVAKTLEAGIRGVAFDNLQWNARRLSRREPRRHPVRRRQSVRIRLLQEFRQDAPPGHRGGTCSGQFGIVTLRRQLHVPRRHLSEPKSSSTAAATAATTGRHRASTATSSCVPAIAFRSFPATWRRSTPSLAITPQFAARPGHAGLLAERSRAATRTASTSPTASTTSDRAARRATRSSTWGWPIGPRPGSKLFLQVNNLFDTQYYTAAQLGPTGFTDNGNFVARPFATPVIDGERPLVHATFYAPGAPRMIWAGVRYTFDTKGL